MTMKPDRKTNSEGGNCSCHCHCQRPSSPIAADQQLSPSPGTSLVTDADYEYISHVLVCAREVQEFLWSKDRSSSNDIDHWLALLEKRLVKLRQLDRSNPHYKIELRKRLLQLAGLSVYWLTALQKDYK